MTLLGAAAACAQLDPDTTPDQVGQEALGISRFDVQEAGDVTTVVGLDAAGVEVGRMQLTHGKFAVSQAFQDDYPGMTEVDGRKLTASVDGQTFHWETAGYNPVLEMPAHPAGKWALAAFMDAPAAKAVLDRWQIGFEPYVYDSLLAGEEAYGSGSGFWRGDSPMSCDNSTSCGTAYNNKTINTCNGGTSISAKRVTRRYGANCGYYSLWKMDEHMVSQCCPTGSGGKNFPWFAYKSCPTTASRDSTCGYAGANAACKGCAVYNSSSSCSVTQQGSPVGSCSGVSVYQDDYAWSNPNQVTLTVRANCDVYSGSTSGSKSLYYNGTAVTCYFNPANGPQYAEKSWTFSSSQQVTVTRSTTGSNIIFSWTVTPAPLSCANGSTSCTQTLSSDATVIEGTFIRDVCPTC